ncbi:MAG: hypothetical protein HGN29_09105 [Asgard group archaeon]|nr:hypothetical protein [Asgard group archaeon]
MNDEKINEVGNLLEIDSSDIQESKQKKIWKKLIFPVVQISTIVLSAILGALMGYWENNRSSGYPASWLYPRIFFLGPIALFGFIVGNISISSKNYKKIGLRGVYAAIIIFMNILISVASLAFTYMAIRTTPPVILGSYVMYGTYKKPKYGK